MSIKQHLISQFKKPRGILGSLAGRIMATRDSNIRRNQWLIELAELVDHSQVLEIGFGPGVALAHAAAIVTKGQILGVDHSQTMLTQASRRLAHDLSKGRVRLMLADIQEHPDLGKKFDVIYASNVVQFWKDAESVCRYLATLLKPDGKLLLLFMPRTKAASDKGTRYYGEQYEQMLLSAGFSSVTSFYQDFDGVEAVCLRGSLPHGTR